MARRIIPERTIDRLTADVIRGEEVYPGVRVAVPASIHRAQIRLRVDVSVGDPVTPGVIEVAYPSLLAEPFPVAGYSMSSCRCDRRGAPLGTSAPIGG